jgi:hypothetical protein
MKPIKKLPAPGTQRPAHAMEFGFRMWYFVINLRIRKTGVRRQEIEERMIYLLNLRSKRV